MRSVRVLRELRSRSKHKDAPKHAELTIIRGGIEETVKLPLEEYPVLLHFPLFAPPGYLHNDDVSGIKMKGIATVNFGPHPDEVLKKLGADSISISTKGDKPTSFAKMIAKIAYAFAFAEGKLSMIEDESLLLPSILGKADDIGLWVGTLTEPIESHEGQLHRNMHVVYYRLSWFSSLGLL